MQEEIEWRDITIIYHDLRHQAKVAINDIVSEFFKHHLKDYNDNFNNMALAAKIANFIPLAQLRNYDVTLNTTNKGENSVISNAGMSFASYNKKKQLRFYIHNLEANKSGSEVDKETNINFCLMKGNMVDREQSVDISHMNFNDFQKKMREIFNIDPTMPIKYKNIRDNTFINFSHAEQPLKLLNRIRITKVGVHPQYEAGGSE